MPDQDWVVGEAGGLIFRGLRGESDYALMLSIVRSSLEADHSHEEVHLEDFPQTYTPSDKMDPTRQVLIAALAHDPDHPIAYSRLGWYSSSPQNRLYNQTSNLRREYRASGLWPEIVRQNEIRLRELAREHAPVAQRFFQAWSSDNQVDWIQVMEQTAYQVVRRFNNMLYPLGEVPGVALPAGFEIRPVQPQHMRSIWEAQKEMNDGLFENVVEDWTEDKFPAWLADASHTPHLWQVAWDGDQLAGMVLSRIDEKENAERGIKRGYTEHVYVRPAWRKRGLAQALIARSLQALKYHGMQEAELGVDSENESAAFRLYQNMGYQTFSVDTWFRKPMDL